MSLISDNGWRMELQPRILKKFITESGVCPFDKWFDGLRDKKTQAIISTRLNRLIQGNLGYCRGLGQGLMELKIDYGPGFRVYFAEDGDVIILLLCGGDKSTQDSDITRARKLLETYLNQKD